RSLPFLMLDVNPDRLDEIVRFTSQFGVLGEPEPAEWKKMHKGRGEPTSLRCVSMTVERFCRVHRELKETLAWISQMNPGPPDLLPGFHEEETRELQSYAEQSIHETLEEGFSEKLQPVHLWPKWNDATGGWVTHWDIGTLEAGLYLMLLLHMQGHGRIQTCPR